MSSGLVGLTKSFQFVTSRSPEGSRVESSTVDELYACPVGSPFASPAQEAGQHAAQRGAYMRLKILFGALKEAGLLEDF